MYVSRIKIQDSEAKWMVVSLTLSIILLNKNLNIKSSYCCIALSLLSNNLARVASRCSKDDRQWRQCQFSGTTDNSSVSDQSLSHSHHRHGCPRLHQSQGWPPPWCVCHEQRYLSNVVINARWWLCCVYPDDLAALCMKLYEQSCEVFSEKWSMEAQVKKKEQEILNLEAECCDSHGTFKVPKLKKVQRFKMEQEDWSVSTKKCYCPLK